MSPEAKKKLLAKCNGHCAYCGRKLSLGTLTIDHFIPLSRGGSNVFSNLLPSCRACNVAKGNKDLEAFRKVVNLKRNIKRQRKVPVRRERPHKRKKNSCGKAMVT